MERARHTSRRRGRGDDGTALVELALIMAPLFLMLFGIIVYGYLMSFRQNMTQAAAEGARAGAVAPYDDAHYYATNQATIATDQALGSFGEGCGNGRMTCNVSVGFCPSSTTVQCVTVTVSYDYANHPLMPDLPLVSNVIPGTFTSSSTTQINQSGQ